MEDYKIRDDFKKNYGISFMASWLIIKMFFFPNERAATTLLTIRLIERSGGKNVPLLPLRCQVFKRSGIQSGVKAASFTPCFFAALYAVILLSAVILTFELR